MSKVVALMSMSLDGYVADPDDGVAGVFAWYFNSGDVEFHTGGATRYARRSSYAPPSLFHQRHLDGCCDHRAMIADEALHRRYRLEAREPAGLRRGGTAV